MTEVGSLNTIFEQAITLRDFYECYDGWTSFILINKKDLMDSAAKIYQKMPIFMSPDEKLLSDHPLVIWYTEWKEYRLQEAVVSEAVLEVEEQILREEEENIHRQEEALIQVEEEIKEENEVHAVRHSSDSSSNENAEDSEPEK